MPADYSSTFLIPAATIVPEDIRALVRQRIPGGIEIAMDDSHQAVSDTKRCLQNGEGLLYNAAFTLEGIVITVDVLVKQGGKWFAYLVRPSTRIKENHLIDAALHDYMLHKSGLQLGNLSLLLLNTNYVRRGELSPKDLFIEEHIGNRIGAYRSEVRNRMQMLKRIAAKRAKGEERLKNPLPIFNVDTPIPSQIPLPVELQVDREALSGFLQGLRYPLYFMDFESYQTALPEYDGHWPFRQLPFQFSVHRLDAPGEALHHAAFVAPPKEEPTAAFGAALLQAIGDKGSVLVYNLDSEKLILDQLEKSHPHWSASIHLLRERLVDLLVPFSKQYIRIPSIGNKLSLKYVLPAMVPEMNYSALAIANGEEVNQAYNAIRKSTDPAFIEETKTALLAYCKVDTLAMVKILERMQELVVDQ